MNIETKQTAIQYLEDKVYNILSEYSKASIPFYLEKVFNKAKQMEKEQIIDAYDDGVKNEISIYSTMDSEQYYNEQFGK